MSKYGIFCFFMILFCFSSCAILPSYRAEHEGRKMITDYPMNRIAVEKAIKQQRVMYGMTMEEVIQSWGNPEIEHELIINGKVYYSWAYKKNNRTKILYFHRGILVDMR